MYFDQYTYTVFSLLGNTPLFTATYVEASFWSSLGYVCISNENVGFQL
jgi:hypothetical protein